jgi:SAM-dependent methyltransferase
MPEQADQPAPPDQPEPPDWPAYYAVTVGRPAWRTVVVAAEAFAADDAGGGAPVDRREPAEPRFAVDLGCGAGRDTRELLRRGWRVLAIDAEPAAIEALREAAAAEDLPRLETTVADLATFAIPSADLVNASISLPFLAADAFHATLARALAAVRPGGRFATMLFGDRDQSADEPGMTCPSADTVRAALTGFEIEDWVDREEDGKTALGEPHHWHSIEVVARRIGPAHADATKEGAR